MADVNFTIGGEFGKMLYNVAVEKVLEDMNPEEGVRVITNSLIGCPTQYAILVIKGEYFLDTDGNCNVCITDDYNELTKNTVGDTSHSNGNYVTNGLMVDLDGVNNAGNGSHNSNASTTKSVWKDWSLV